ncbi:hypothetical protein J6590_093455 [Homalodisca vitripennis]|nr:hypothetical protein J6590_093455 [Homalodisca vitripennis]
MSDYRVDMAALTLCILSLPGTTVLTGLLSGQRGGQPQKLHYGVQITRAVLCIQNRNGLHGLVRQEMSLPPGQRDAGGSCRRRQTHFRFLKWNSTTEAVAELVTQAVSSLDKRERLVGVIIEIFKAFDSDSHSKFLDLGGDGAR